jgi:hypothetical protein
MYPTFISYNIKGLHNRHFTIYITLTKINIIEVAKPTFHIDFHDPTVSDINIATT